MGFLGGIVDRVKSDMSYKAGREVSGAIGKGASKIFKPGSKSSGNDCPKCKKALSSSGLKFCTNCGFKLFVTCPSCKTDYPIATKFCAQCGGTLKK